MFACRDHDIARRQHRRGRAVLAGSIAAALSVGACGSSVASDDGDSCSTDLPFTPPNGGAPLDEVTSALSFELVPCADSDRMEFQSTPMPGATSCGFVKVPIFWGDRGAGSIRLMLRYAPAYSLVLPFPGQPPPSGPSKGSVWLLPGGPGLAGTTRVGDARELSKQGYDVYVMDHRGTGRSTPLLCPDAAVASEREHMKQCGAALADVWGARLAGFSTTEAARDLGELIAATRKPGEKVFVWGHSYGTYLVHRYLRLYPAQATGVVLEGVLSPTGSLLTFPMGADSVLETYLASCAGHGTCGAKLGADPLGVLARVLAKLETPGYCATRFQLTREDYRAMLFSMILTPDTGVHNVPPLLYRLDRCNAEDVAAIEHGVSAVGFGAAAQASPYGPAVSFSDGLYYHIALSELVPDPLPTAAELEASYASLRVHDEFSGELLAAWSSWPRYPRDEHYGKAGSPTTPALLLNGTLDPNTPWAQARDTALQHYGAPHQTFVTVPWGRHKVGFECRLTQILAFFADPTAAITDPCPAVDLEALFTVHPIRGPLFNNYGIAGKDPYEGGPLVNPVAFPGLPPPPAALASPGEPGAVRGTGTAPARRSWQIRAQPRL